MLAHARRKLFDEFERTKSPIAEEALKRIGKLYDIEADITGFDAELRQKARKDLAVPILDELKTWFHEQRRRLSSKSNLAKALQYALTRWTRLFFTPLTAASASTTIPPSVPCAGSPLREKTFCSSAQTPAENAPRCSTRFSRAQNSIGSIQKPISPTSSTAWQRGTRSTGSANCCPGIGNSRKQTSPLKPMWLWADAYFQVVIWFG